MRCDSWTDKPNPTLPIADLQLLKLTSMVDGQVQADTPNCSSNYHSEIDGQEQLTDSQLLHIL